MEVTFKVVVLSLLVGALLFVAYQLTQGRISDEVSGTIVLSAPTAVQPLCTVHQDYDERIRRLEEQLLVYSVQTDRQSPLVTFFPDRMVLTAYSTGTETALGTYPSVGTLAVRNSSLLLKVFQLEGAPDYVPVRLVALDLMPELAYDKPVSMNSADIYIPDSGKALQFGRRTARVVGIRRTRLCEVVLLKLED